MSLPMPRASYGTSYRLVVRASDEMGRAQTRRLSFTTLAKDERLIGMFTPEDGSTVGVGMPVSVPFNKPVIDKKAVEPGIRVTDDVAARSSWATGSEISAWTCARRRTGRRAPGSP